MTKGLLCSHKDVNHEIWKGSFVAMTEKVLQVLNHKLHLFPALGRMAHNIYFYSHSEPIFPYVHGRMGRPRARSQSLSSSRLCGTTRCQMPPGRTRTGCTRHVGRKEATFHEGFYRREERGRGRRRTWGRTGGTITKMLHGKRYFLRALDGMRVWDKGTK